VIETTKQYKMFLESLKILATFNTELTHVLVKVRDLSKKGKEVRINKLKGQNILKKNRELRIQLKSLINDNGITSSINGSFTSKVGKNKRALIQERDVLLNKNDELMFKFKKAFLL
jgi:hypothetical protein